MRDAHVEMSIRNHESVDVTLQGRLDHVVDSLRRLYPELFAVDREPAGTQPPAPGQHSQTCGARGFPFRCTCGLDYKDGGK